MRKNVVGMIEGLILSALSCTHWDLHPMDKGVLLYIFIENTYYRDIKYKSTDFIFRKFFNSK